MAGLTRDRIDAEHYVARYARGSLSAQEAEQFEEYCLLHPELVRDVGADRAMRRALKSIHSRDAGSVHRVRWRHLAIAASLLVIAVAVGWQFRPSAAHDDVLYAASNYLPAGLREHLAGPFAVVRSRGSGVQTLRIPAGARSASLELELPGSHAVARYQLTLEEALADAWVTRGRIEVSSAVVGGTVIVPVIIDLREVKGPRVRLILSGADGAVDAFDLRLEQAR